MARPTHAGFARTHALRGLAAALSLLAGGSALAADVAAPPIPRPQSAPPSAALERSLAEWDAKQRDEARDCAAQVAEMKEQDPDSSTTAEFDLRYEVLLDTPKLFSVGVNLNAACGGAYPAHAATGVVFDAASGRRYDPSRLYAVARKGPDGREFLPQARDMIRKELLAKRGAAADDDECVQVLKDDDIRLVEDGILALARDGLHVLYSGPHAVQACYEPVVLPYARLKQFLNEKEAARLDWRP